MQDTQKSNVQSKTVWKLKATKLNGNKAGRKLLIVGVISVVQAKLLTGSYRVYLQNASPLGN